MREIKFRVWEGEKVVSLSKAIYLDLVCIQYNSNDCFEIEPVFCDVKIMQFTGLMDKNGVEIYEGDIIKWGHIEGYNERIPRCATVEFSPELAFKTFNLGNNNQRFGFSNFMYKCTDKAIEVLGNIYEHRELLEGAE